MAETDLTPEGSLEPRRDVPGSYVDCYGPCLLENIRYCELEGKLVSKGAVPEIPSDVFETCFDSEYEFAYPETMERYYPNWKFAALMYKFIREKPYMGPSEQQSEIHLRRYGFNEETVYQGIFDTFTAAYEKYSVDVARELVGDGTVIQCSGCGKLLNEYDEDCCNCIGWHFYHYVIDAMTKD